MAGKIDARLAELGVEIHDVAPPAANYVPFVQSGDLVFISGQVSRGADGNVTGKLGANMDVDGGVAAARICGINLITQMKAACGGDLDRVAQVVKLTGFVNSAEGFGDQPKVINGASDLFVEVFGDKGRHSRSAVGVAELPFNVAVEIEAIFRIA